MSDWTKSQYNMDLDSKDFENIKNIFISHLIIPKTKPDRQFLLCPVGLIGSGKTTVIVPLSEKLNLLRVSHDEIRKILKENGFNYNSSKEIARSVILDFLKDGYSVAIDANCGSKETYNNIKNIEKEFGIKTFWVHINPPEEFILNKLKNFNHTWLFKNGDEAVKGYLNYKDKYGDGTDLGIDFIYVFDTSRSDIKIQIEEARKVILDSLSF